MKTFKDLEFKPHPNFGSFNTQARLDFDNGYGISVVNGKMAYCNENEYEVAIFKNGSICYTTPITDDVLGYNSPENVTEIMKQIQELK